MIRYETQDSRFTLRLGGDPGSDLWIWDGQDDGHRYLLDLADSMMHSVGMFYLLHAINGDGWAG